MRADVQQRNLVFVVSLALVLIARGAGAQSTFGSIVGTAQDQSSLAVPGATITLRSMDESSTQSLESDAAGGFQFLNLKPGTYEIEATLSGFSDVRLQNLRLDARQTLRVNVTLAIAGFAEDLKVLADAPAITTDTGTIADTKTFQQVTQLPVNYRGSTTSPLAAIDTVVGVQQDNNGNVSIGGGTPSMVQYSVDGISSVNVRSNGALANLNPSSELIREFRVAPISDKLVGFEEVLRRRRACWVCRSLTETNMTTKQTIIAALALAVGAASTSAHAQEVSGAIAEAGAQAPVAQVPVTPAEPEAKKPDPFAFADFTWLSGNPRTKEAPLDTKVFTGEFRADTNFTYSFNKPADDTIVGSSEIFRSGEFQVTQLGIGGDFHYDNVQGRLMTQFGMYSQTTPRNDASPERGQWQLDTAYRYISEAYGGYHFDKMNGINVQAGIFMSYVGLWSYYNFDNWTYQPSYVSSNTPWFFNGMRVQFFPTEKLKIEPWIINGWQSYGKFNHAPGLGGQILYRPTGSVSVLFNNYWGTDTLGNPDRKRVHTDDSIQVKYYDRPDNAISKAAFTFTFDAGCEYGGGVSCGGGTEAAPSQTFLGFMAYNRLWFDKDRFGLTVGGGAINNPGRYLVLIPPINGANAFSGTPYFTASPGDPYKAWDTQVTFDYMPSQFITFRSEYNYRHANVPYFAGAGGVTPPGGNTGAPGSFVPGWAPDLRPSENRVTFAMLVKL